MDLIDLKLMSNQIRKDILNMIYEAKSGHPAGALGMADFFTYLYFDYLENEYIKNDKNNKKNQNKNGNDLIKKESNERDFIILSNGHIVPVLYSILARKGYFPISKLKSFRKFGSELQGHPFKEQFSIKESGFFEEKIKHPKSLKGIEVSSGPLGQGISQAVGLAVSLKRDKKENKVFCFMGDGELAEGQCWEAFMYASKEELNNLCIIVDRNNIQIDGKTDDISGLKNLHKKLSSFGLFVLEINGNDFNQIKIAFNHFKNGISNNKPFCIIANTIPGKDISFMENNNNWHGKVPNEEEMKIALLELEAIKKNLESEK